MPKYHIDETSYPYLDADGWWPGRRSQCGWEVPQDRLLSYEDFRRRVQAEGVDDLCGLCGTKPLPIL